MATESQSETRRKRESWKRISELSGLSPGKSDEDLFHYIMRSGTRLCFIRFHHWVLDPKARYWEVAVELAR